jgi:hypothetical protein
MNFDKIMIKGKDALKKVMFLITLDALKKVMFLILPHKGVFWRLYTPPLLRPQIV